MSRVFDRILEAICGYADRRGARQAAQVRRQKAYEHALRQNAARERWIEAGRRHD